MPGISRNDLQALARSKLADAELLLRHGRSSSAYYLTGYVVELGLKAAIAKQFLKHVLPDPKLLSRGLYTHDLLQLVGLAGLGAALQTAKRNDKRFNANWLVVEGWRVESRYEAMDPVDAATLFAAVSEKGSGVLPWLEKHW